jgi:cytoskeleton protein RodZ
MDTSTRGDASPRDESLGFGEFLRRAREQRGLTRQQISSETKIPLRHLEALEDGDLAAVPGGIYQRGEVRAYARAVGLDEDLALSTLEHTLEATAGDGQEARVAEPLPAPAAASHPGRRMAVAGTMVVALAVVTLAFVRQPAPPQTDSLPAPSAIEGDHVAQPASDSLVMRERDAVAAADVELDADGPAVPASTHRAGAVDSAPAVAPDATPRVPAAAADAATARRPQPEARPLSRPEPPDGQLVIVTEPAGARVTVNGIGWGQTPLTIRHLPLGAMRIRITKDGYAAATHVVRLDAARPAATVQVALRHVE